MPSEGIRRKTTREIYNSNKDRTPPAAMPDLVLWLHNIRSMHNVGSAFRTADAFAIKHLFLSGYTPFPPRPEISKTALGADQTVSWSHEADPDTFVKWCNENNYLLAGMEQTHQSRLLSDYKPQKDVPVCILFGNEVTGIDQQLLNQCNTLLEIPQYGKKHSFNISVSIGITLYHFLLSYLP